MSVSEPVPLTHESRDAALTSLGTRVRPIFSGTYRVPLSSHGCQKQKKAFRVLKVVSSDKLIEGRLRRRRQEENLASEAELRSRPTLKSPPDGRRLVPSSHTRVPRSYAGRQQMSAALRCHGRPCELGSFRRYSRRLPKTGRSGLTPGRVY
uniref:Uncharacterized protein n=1 Tax=Timema genevievae TaxID=629358 RepID=A0A7R9K6L2_TIMGE|nr:unnamed protein product [Timema genevievae]